MTGTARGRLGRLLFPLILLLSLLLSAGRGVGGATAATTGPDAAEMAPTPIYLAHLNANTAATPTGAMALAFARDIAERSGGRLKVETFPEGQLGRDEDVLGLVSRGVIQSAIVSVGGISRIYPRIAVLDDPFAFRRLDDAYRVFDGSFGRDLATDIERATGLKVLGFGDTGGLFVLTNNRRPIHRPADLEGLRVRTMAVESHQRFIAGLGGEPVPMAWRDLYGALLNEVVDGQMNPVSIIRAGRLERVQTFLTVTNHFYTPYVWVANAGFLNALPAGDRRDVAEAARAGVAASRALAAEGGDRLDGLDHDLRITRLSETGLAAFRAKTRPVMEDFVRDRLGGDGLALLDAFRRAAKEAAAGR